ncbi:MAG TPA: cytochrome c biogenesis protein CcdA [Acidimicrobiales bacterium]|nr:cytochrome c biogenesis protein CcdA [Acidimicrobiales bacterium]
MAGAAALFFPAAPAAISADPAGVLVAFGAGILSFVSPCVLPLVPGYVSMVSGLSAAELEAGGESATPSAALRPVLRGIALFVAGFTIVFVALGATASGIGHLLTTHRVTLTYISGGIIVFLGVVMLVSALPSAVWANAGSGTLGLMSRVTGEHRFDVRPSRLGKWAAPIMGMAFAFAWTPCVGPVLGVVLGLASRTGTLAGGVVLLLAYSLGLALPFVLVGLAFGRFTAAMGKARHWLWAVELVAGALLIGFGVILLTDNIAVISNHVSSWLNDIGLGRLSRS